MKNLVKEWEELKKTDTKIIETAYDALVDEIRQNTIDKVLEVANQYNIIAVPKSIKLSEILKYYNDKKNQYCLVPIKLDNGKYKIRVKYGDNYWEDYKLEIQNGKISPISLNLPVIEFKWLYTLWIADTTIVDDLKEEK